MLIKSLQIYIRVFQFKVFILVLFSTLFKVDELAFYL